jgi:predicted porin
MNKNIKLAVAGAVLALGATAANAGIIIPAGDWTLDVSGNVNSYYTQTRATGGTVVGGLAGASATGTRSTANISTGLLPNFLSVAGSTRQNDLDVTFLISINPGSSQLNAASGGSGTEHRQAFMTFGDKSWGSIKLGKDLGIFASDAILNDMTLLGVGSASGSPTTTTLGRIGTGFMYADWKSQIAYTTPNMSGFQATVGLTQAWNAQASTLTAAVFDPTTASSVNGSAATLASAGTTARGGASTAYEGKASYSFAANDVTGKLWVGGFAQKIDGLVYHADKDNFAWAADVGANVNLAGFGLTGYYYKGEGVGTTFMLKDGFDTSGRRRESDGGYVQATYVLPTKTKAGISWGQSNLDKTAETATALVKENEMWTAGLYHPVTKHLNLVGEYNYVKATSQTNVEAKTNNVSLGAILFF